MKNSIYITISPRTALFFIIIVGVGAILYHLRDLIPLLISAIVFALALEPGKHFLAKFRIPGQIAVVLLYSFVFLFIFVLFYLFLPIIVQQSQFFFNSLPNLVSHLESIVSGTIFEPIFAGFDVSTLPTYTDGIGKTFLTLFETTGSSIASLFGNILNIILFLLLTFLFAVSPQSLDNFIHVITPKEYHSYIEDLWSRTKNKIGQWLQGQLILVFLMSVLSYLGLTLIGVPNALFLGVFAGIFELLPIFGPILGAIPAILMAASTGDFTLVLFTMLLFFILQQIEGNLLYPLIVNKVVGISSVLIVLAIVIGGLLAGVVGVIIAVPLVGVIQEFFSDIQSGKIEKLQQSIRKMQK